MNVGQTETIFSKNIHGRKLPTEIEKMMKEIKCLNFAIIELSEYLDTHPDDRKAICLHKEYCNELNEIKDKYQKIFGPLSIYHPCNKWRWLEGPWPWERSDFNVDL